MFKRRKKVRLVLLLVAIVAGITFGHGIGATTVKPIKVGALIPLSGPFSADGVAFHDGIKMAIDELNEEGGLLGRSVKMVVFDIEDMMAEKLVAAAEELIGRQKVDFVVTGYAGMGPDVEYFGKYDVPYFHFDGSIRTVEMVRNDPNKWNVFMMGDVEEPYGRTTFDIVSNLSYDFPNKKVAIISGDFEWDRLYTQGIAKRAKEKGWKVVIYEVVPYGTREWRPLLTKIRSENPAVVVFEILSPPDAATFLRQFKQCPTDSLIQFGYVMIIPEFLEIMGKEADGALGITTNAAIPVTKKGKAWIERFKKKYGRKPKSISGTVWDGVMCWAQAVKEIGDVTKYREICKYIEDHPYHGVVGVFDFDEDHKVLESLSMPMHYYQVQNGDAVLYHLHTAPVEGVEFKLPPWMK